MALKKKKITLEDLAAMVQRGFQETAKQVDVDQRFAAVDKRFEAIDKRFDKVENRLINIESDISYLKARVNEIDRKLDISQDEVETRLTRLEKKVAVK